MLSCAGLLIGLAGCGGKRNKNGHDSTVERITPIHETSVQPPSDAYNVVTISAGDLVPAVLKRLEALKKGVKVEQAKNSVGGVDSLSTFESTDEIAGGDSHVSEGIDVSFTGPPGSEQVYGVTRSQVFSESASPSVESVRAALIAKYGQPLRVQHDAELAPWHFSWVRPIDPAKPVDAGICLGEEKASAADQRAANCGTIIIAEARVQVNEPRLTERLEVKLTGGASGEERLERWREQAQILEEQRQAAESEQAIKESDVKAGRPSL